MNFLSPIEEFPFDREAIRKVLINLFTNAAEALKGVYDGQVRVTANHDKGAGLVTITVADNGSGLPRILLGYSSRITPRKGRHWPWLTIVRSIVADHHGKVRAEANTPTGTVFIIDLPDA